jgi:hypothetical protein
LPNIPAVCYVLLVLMLPFALAFAKFLFLMNLLRVKMREIGKIGLRALALALALLGSGATYASHTVGGWISYEYTGATTGVANQYRVRLVLVREQGSLNYGTFQSVKI